VAPGCVRAACAGDESGKLGPLPTRPVPELPRMPRFEPPPTPIFDFDRPEAEG